MRPAFSFSSSTHFSQALDPVSNPFFQKAESVEVLGGHARPIVETKGNMFNKSVFLGSAIDLLNMALSQNLGVDFV